MGTVLVGQFSRMFARRASEAGDPEALLESAPAAAADTVGVAVRGYEEAPRYETVLFNLLAGFLGSFATVRLSTWAIRDGRGPFRNVSIGGRHIHHFVPGILLAFGSGTAALLTAHGYRAHLRNRLDYQHARSRIPRIQIELPESIKTPARDRAQIERRRSGTPESM